MFTFALLSQPIQLALSRASDRTYGHTIRRYTSRVSRNPGEVLIVRINTYRVETNEQGFAALAQIYAAIEREPAKEVIVDCSRLQWIDANMCATLAAAIIATDRPIRLQKL